MFEQIPEILYEAPLSNKAPPPSLFRGEKLISPPPLPFIIVHQ